MDTSSIPLTTAAIIIPIFSLFAILLDIPPISWHIRNCNIGSSALILWLIILNTSNFLNALIWPRNNMQGWWKGEGYCDIQVRLLVGGSIGGLPGAVLCIMKALARVLDPKKTIVNASSADRRRRFVMDGLLCFGLPIFFMVVLYVVHSWRYNIVGVSGCDVTLDRSWVTIVLLFIWPPILLLVSCYYACLVIFRLYRYRAQTAGLLHLNKTTRSRFLRLFIMAVFVLLLLFPAQLVQLFTFALDHRQEPFHPYSWSLVHTDWDLAILISSKAVPTPWGKYSWIAEGYVVFAFFGLGCDARDMYRGWLAWLGLGKLFPSLLEKTQHKRSSGSNTWFGSMGSKAKVLFSRKGSADDSV
ncbi:fungal pheromone STE3G-protein-coupled receptor [Tothia fuscella]|uniref:Fungal pheromone STE3G-protein-coupled receptor n=1 Tax=Tothia fuscella TaxID=1048955 RepID=A0A9P4NEN9_9PEZI|nr:fungal pheromone STE3G-protein-coupled receptor [Tothia fuscella]